MSAIVHDFSKAAPVAETPLLSASTLTSAVFQQPRSRRRFERIKLHEKVPALLDGRLAVLIDLSLSGVQLEHEHVLRDGDSLTLEFDWRGDQVTVECEVIWTRFHGFSSRSRQKVYRSGLVFRRHRGDSGLVLRSIVTELVERALDEQKANANGVPPRLASYMVSGKIRGYLRLRLIHGVWQHVATGDPMQPADGFTVSIDEAPDQIKLLCETYEKLSSANRDLVRKMAELSVCNPDGLPARRYEP